jgi:ribose/xylose/arabinose/galactoside ABC-type transport system permease subunit
MRKVFSTQNIPFLATVAVCAVLYLAAAISFRGFASIPVLVNFFTDNSFLGIAALGLTFVILSGGIDLSVGGVLGLTSITLALLLEEARLSSFAAISIVLLGGAAFGLIQGILIQSFGLPPFLITLAGMFLTRGVALLLHDSMPIKHGIEGLAKIGLTIGSQTIPGTALIFVGVLLASVFIAHFTKLGRNIYAVGGNENSSFLLGLPVGKTKIAVYGLAGLCSALAGVVNVLYKQSGDPNAGIGLELDAIAAVVIGGTLLTGGVGNVFGTLLGVLILGIIQTARDFQGRLSPWWTRITIGLLLLAFILLQRFLQTRKFGTPRATQPSR